MSAEEFNLGKVHETIAGAIGSRQCLAHGDRSWTYEEIAERSRRFASFLHERGLGLHTERAELAGYESGQDHLALYLYNCNEYVEGMLGAYKARVAPFNVNYRYVEEELLYLLMDAGARGIVYHAQFVPVLERVLPKLPQLDLLVQVEDFSGNALLPGAIEYEKALASALPELPPVEPSPDDLYIIYTGGTTGMPKGVLWRQHDIFVAAMGGRVFGTWDVLQGYDQLVSRILGGQPMRVMSIPPLMHAAAQWGFFYNMSIGGTVVFPPNVRSLDPAEIWRTVEREGVNAIAVVGDAMARPLIEELERGSYDSSSLIAFGSGGAILSEGIKQRLLAKMPTIMVSDVAGASETGVQMGQVSVSGAVQTGHFTPGPGTTVLSADLTEELAPGEKSLGWLAQRGAVPLGYLGDAEKTKRTFPVVEGVRFSIPGDRARFLAGGEIELLGRDAVTINSGGEKIFAEEVEQALLCHSDVLDVVVAGRPNERWGQEVVALVQVKEGSGVTAEDLLAEAAKHLARYKLPKAIGFEKEIVRSPSGKADYRWAKEKASEV